VPRTLRPWHLSDGTGIFLMARRGNNVCWMLARAASLGAGSCAFAVIARYQAKPRMRSAATP
jgi:hypothetical protein